MEAMSSKQRGSSHAGEQDKVIDMLYDAVDDSMKSVTAWTTSME